MNNVILLGRLTRDVEIKYSQGTDPIAIARFTVAVDKRNKKDGDTTNFINCVAFGKTAENISKFFTKGRMICVQGSLEQSSYTDNNGNKRINTDINVTNFSFCGDSGEKKPLPTKEENPDFYGVETGVEDDDEDLPF